MDGLGNVRIKGVSGKEYKFRAYPLETKFSHFGAVYFITSRNHQINGKISHSRIYCGMANDMSLQIDNTSSFKDYDANCICILPQDDTDVRIAIENDIRKNYTLLCNI
ncbi:MAG: hypothetical protein C0417_06210 [Chlorobiaceae bacterium]|nr:hypothetical protein [Chlorobiaceae bacterium]